MEPGPQEPRQLSSSDRDRILEAGFAGYLKKPVEPIILAQKLDGILDRDHS